MSIDAFSRPGLTGVRALAALLVVGHHLNAIVGPRPLFADLGLVRFEVTHLFTLGWVGVNVFFVLSGFLLTVHLVNRLRDAALRDIVGPYLMARILRVVPAYWFQILVLLLLTWCIAGRWPDWARFVPAHVFFLQNTSFEAHNAINGVYWSLPVEFMFYLLLPVIVVFVSGGRPNESPTRSRISRAILVAIIAIAVTIGWRYIAFRLFRPEGIPQLFWATIQLPGVADQFGLGVLAGCVFHALGSPNAKTSRKWSVGADVMTVCGLAGLAAAMYWMNQSYRGYWEGKLIYFVWNLAASACVALFVFGAAVGGRIANLLFASRLALFIGTVSYGMYLWHLPVAASIAGALDLGHFGLAEFAVLALPAIVVASALSYYGVERPFFNLRRRHPPPAAAAQPELKSQC